MPSSETPDAFFVLLEIVSVVSPPARTKSVVAMTPIFLAPAAVADSAPGPPTVRAPEQAIAD